MLTYEKLEKIAHRTPNRDNANSFLLAVNQYGAQFGVLQPHRLAQIIAQVMHESMEFRYDQEVWGPTPAQKRYEGRKDLGNTQPGDGKKFKGHGPLQVTGRANTAEFESWCVKNFGRKSVPDFEGNPQLINTDPWEGISVLWYWDTRKLNKWADQGDVETVSRRVNGGTNGLAERFAYYDRTSLVLLGFEPDNVLAFQRQAAARGEYLGELDGMSGPKTRSALHRALMSQLPKFALSTDAKPAPVVTKETVVPKPLDKPVSKTSGFWERVGQMLLGSGVIGAVSLDADWKVYAAIGATVLLLGLTGLLLHQRIIATVKAMKGLT